MSARALVAAALVCALGAPALGQEDVPPVDVPPVIDVRDLPPLPEVVLEDQVTSVTVVSATQAEEDVVVGAAKREQSLGNVASAVTVISGDRLRRFGYRTVAEALRGVAGIYLVDDHMSDRVGIRGLQLLGDFNTRILVLVDGATVNEPWNQFAGVGFDMPVSLDEVARIEIIRGPVSSVYGTNAFFGIINIVTRSADQSPRAWGRAGGGIISGVGGSAGFAAGGVNEQVRGTFSYQQRAGETLSLDALGQDTGADGMDALQGGVIAHYRGGFLQLRAYRRQRELPFAPYETAPGDSRNRNTDQHFMAEGGYSFDLGPKLSLAVRGYFNRYQFKDYLVYEPDDANFLDFGDSTWFGGEARARYAIVGQDLLGVTVGAEATRQLTESRSFYEGMEADGTVVPKNFTLFGVYAEADSAPARWLSLTAGLRLDQNSVLADRVSPRAALFLHDGEEVGFKLLYAEGFRNASAYEAFFEDGVDFIANPELSPETIRSYEAVLWGRPRAGLSLRLSGFFWDLTDLIEQGEVDTPDGPRLQFANVTSIQSMGVEVEGSYRDTRGWYAYGHATYADVNLLLDGGGDEEALNSPRVVAGLGASSPAIAGLVHVSSELFYVSRRLSRDPAVAASPFVGWNLAVYVPDWHGFDLTVGARNLLGTAEEVVAQEDYDRSDDLGDPVLVPILPGEGREVYARLGYRY